MMLKPWPFGWRSTPGQELEVDVVDALAVLEAVDQVQRRAADAADRRQAQLHRPGRHLDRLRAQLERARVGLVRILHAKRQRAGARPVLGGEVAGQAARLAVDDEVDVALAVQHDVLAAVAGDQAEAQLLEQRLQHVRRGRGEFDELESHQAHRVVEEIRHRVAPWRFSACAKCGEPDAAGHQVPRGGAQARPRTDAAMCSANVIASQSKGSCMSGRMASGWASSGPAPVARPKAERGV